MERFGASLKGILDIAASVALIGAVGLVAWLALKQPAPPPPVKAEWPVETELPRQRAPVGVVMFSDFECPFCAQFSTQTLPAFVSSFVETGKVSLAFRHLPLAIHRNALKAARLGVCAANSGEFWRAHDFLFAPPSNLAELDETTFATRLGLHANAISDCFTSSDTNARVQVDIKEAERLGIRSTPTFLLGRFDAGGRLDVVERFSGAAPLTHFQAALARLE